MTTIASRLERAMLQRGWDQSKLADEVGATQGAISKILVGRTANSRLMPKIATKLGVGLPWLLGEGEEESLGEQLSSDELDWVELYRTLDSNDRQALVTLVKSLVRNMPVPSLHEPARKYRPGQLEDKRS